MPTDGGLYDVAIIVGDERFVAHKVILSESSHYFRAMFYSNFREADQKEIHLRDMDAAALKSLLEYTYKGSTEIGPDNVESLLAVACNLQFTQVQKECCDYLEKQLDPCNCIGIAKLANLHACHQLAEKARSFACRQFLLLTNEEEILNLTATEMVPLLSYDDLTVDAEEDVLKAACRWFLHDPDGRQELVPTVLQEIRFSLVDEDCLRKMLLTLVEDAKLRRWLKTLFSQISLYSMKTHLPSQRERNSVRRFAYVAGGQQLDENNGPKDTMERYDPVKNVWTKSAGPDRWGWSPKGGIVENSLFLLEEMGSTETRICPPGGQCFRYDPYTDVWELSNLPFARVWPYIDSSSVTVLHETFYVLGGHTREIYEGQEESGSATRSVRTFDVRTKTWCNKTESPRIGRFSSAVAIMDEKLYVAGGYTKMNDDGSIAATTYVERYDPASNQWNIIPHMRKARSSFGLAEMNGCLYAIGGRGTNETLKSCEKYDPRVGKWTRISDMSCPRNGHTVFVLGNNLYACGGLDGFDYLNTMEMYDSQSDSWIPRASMEHTRWDAVAGIMEAPLYPSNALTIKSFWAE